MTQYDPLSMEAHISSDLLGADVIYTAMFGRINLAVTKATLPQFRRILGSTVNPRWIINVLEITGFDPDAVSGGNGWFSAFRAHRGSEVVFVSMQPGARMAARAIGFGTGIKIATFENCEAAYAHVGLSEIGSRARDAAPRSGEFAVRSALGAGKEARVDPPLASTGGMTGKRAIR